MPGKWVKPGSEKTLPSELTTRELRSIVATLFKLEPEKVTHFVILAYSERDDNPPEIYHSMCCNECFALVNPNFRPDGITTSVDPEQ